MKKSCPALTAVLLACAGLSLTGTAAAGTPPCNVPPQLTMAAEMRLGGAIYEPAAAAQHAGHAKDQAAEGAHLVHDSRRGGTFYMAPNRTHHVEAVYTEECGFQLFLYNAFTESIRVDRFQAFVHVFPQRDDEFDIIRFLSPTPDGAVLAATFGGAVSRPFDVELYVRFPDSDEPQMFNIAVPAAAMPAAELHGAASAGLALTAAWSRPVMRDRPGAAYLTITNTGDSADRLLGASSPAFKTVEMHMSRQENNRAMMYPAEAIPVPAKGTVEIAPGGFHLMLFHALQQLKEGDSFPLILTFETAGKVEVEVQVTKDGGQHAGHGSN